MPKDDTLPRPKIDVLKVQEREGVGEDFDGVQYTVLSDLYLHLPQLAGMAEHVLYTASFAAEGAMVDLLGREVRDECAMIVG
jgi:hypothetical protein